jgi:predicted alpha/beta-fold hydrolase
MQGAELEAVIRHAADFQPRRFLRNGHLQTIAGNYLSRADELPVADAQLVEVSPATANQIASQVLCHCHWQPEEARAARPTAIIVHGLEGSSESQYVVGNSNKLWRAGCNVIRMNMRNCGGTEALSPTLYHSGLRSAIDVADRLFDGRKPCPEAGRRTRHGCAGNAPLGDRSFACGRSAGVG